MELRRRRPRGRRRAVSIGVGIGVAIIVMALVAAAGWFVILPNVRPGLRAGESYGIDVSNHQGAIDWRQVGADGIDFAYIKATEGRGYVDQDFARNW